MKETRKKRVPASTEIPSAREATRHFPLHVNVSHVVVVACEHTVEMRLCKLGFFATLSIFRETGKLVSLLAQSRFPTRQRSKETYCLVSGLDRRLKTFHPSAFAVHSGNLPNPRFTRTVTLLTFFPRCRCSSRKRCHFDCVHIRNHGDIAWAPVK